MLRGAPIVRTCRTRGVTVHLAVRPVAHAVVLAGQSCGVRARLPGASLVAPALTPLLPAQLRDAAEPFANLGQRDQAAREAHVCGQHCRWLEAPARWGGRHDFHVEVDRRCGFGSGEANRLWLHRMLYGWKS